MGEVPEEVVTVTSTTPVPAGAIAVIDEAELTEKLVAGVDPKRTELAPPKPVPEIVTEFPPSDGSEEGLRPVTVGP